MSVLHVCYRNEFSRLVGEEYVRHFNLSGMSLDSALRVFLSRLVLSGETQERERIFAHFSRRYLECNPATYHSEGKQIVCALLLVNLHEENYC